MSQNEPNLQQISPLLRGSATCFAKPDSLDLRATFPTAQLNHQRQQLGQGLVCAFPSPPHAEVGLIEPPDVETS